MASQRLLGNRVRANWAGRRAHIAAPCRVAAAPSSTASSRNRAAECSTSGSIRQEHSVFSAGREEGLADWGTRITLERLFRDSSLPEGVAPAAWFAATQLGPQQTRNQERTPDYFANVGDAIRTLREDIPDLFVRDLHYEIYRDDVVFKDPRNTFAGLKNYKTIFWSLRFHGKIFFKRLYVDVKRIWQPEDGVIKMRWTVHGIPRVPWEAEGTFDGISTYKLDNAGRVYEHSVDNVLLRDPPVVTNPPLLAGLNLVPLGGGGTACPGGLSCMAKDGAEDLVSVGPVGGGSSAAAPCPPASMSLAGHAAALDHHAMHSSHGPAGASAHGSSSTPASAATAAAAGGSTRRGWLGSLGRSAAASMPRLEDPMGDGSGCPCALVGASN